LKHSYLEILNLQTVLTIILFTANPCPIFKTESAHPPEKIEYDPKATPPASSKMPKEDNPPFFVYLTRAQKVEYQNDRIEPNIKKALYMFADPLKPTTFLTLTNDIKVLQTNLENSNVLIAQIAMKAKIDRLTSELQIFCNSHNVIIPSTELVECPQTPVLTPLLRAKLLPDKDSNVLKGHSKIGILEFKNWSLNYRKRK